ncbi:MAG: shikimate dehydrogenase [Fibrobacter sp.]|nr:shikimate dehydrogenase [Fibrobacter sp.]
MNTNTLQIKGDTGLLCIIGSPVSQSKSPVLHNHLIQKLGLNLVYIPVHVPSQSLHSMIYTIRNCGFTGGNVTIPHKEHVINYCDHISDLSKKTGTVNTLYVKNGVLNGTTTDYAGFKRGLQLINAELAGSKVVILGNGGTARTIATALTLENDVGSIAIAGRNGDKVKTLAETIKVSTGQSIISCSFADPLFNEVMQECTLLVNTTSAGMHPDTGTTPIDISFFKKQMKVIDVIYNPSKTRFLAEAESKGCAILNGLPMLFYQALESFKFWTGIEITNDILTLDEFRKLVK